MVGDAAQLWLPAGLMAPGEQQ